MNSEDINLLTEFLFIDSEDPKADVALVFGTQHHPDEFARRIGDLWWQNSFRSIIFSGYNGEARQLAAASSRTGLPNSIVTIEDLASNTGENVAFSLEMLKSRAPNKILLGIPKLYSARRALLTMKKYLPDWTFKIASVDYFGVTAADWFHNAAFVAKAAEEIAKIPDYIRRGFIVSPPEPHFSPERLAALSQKLLAWRTILSSSLKDPGHEPS